MGKMSMAHFAGSSPVRSEQTTALWTTWSEYIVNAPTVLQPYPQVKTDSEDGEVAPEFVAQTVLMCLMDDS
jgi:hypothetical protein